MAVEVDYNGVIDELSKTEATTLLGELIDLHGSPNSSSGVYSVEHSNYVAEHERFVFTLRLSDADDADYPIVKDDLSAAIADLSVDLGTAEEVKPELNGTLS